MKPWHKAQKLFEECWLDPKRDRGMPASCLWQAVDPAPGIACVESWMVQDVLYIAQFFNNGAYIVYRQEGK